jgi:hypothetical protein
MVAAGTLESSISAGADVGGAAGETPASAQAGRKTTIIDTTNRNLRSQVIVLIPFYLQALDLQGLGQPFRPLLLPRMISVSRLKQLN